MGWIYRRGGIFVEMFLVLSGFTSFMTYEHRIDAGMSFPKFAMRRAIRIYPLMWATLLTSMTVHMIYYIQHDHTWWLGGEQTLTTLIFGFLGIQAVFPGAQSWNHPAWSLSIFFLCWIIFYVIVRFTGYRKDIRIICCVAMVLLGIGLYRNPLPTQVAILNSSMARGYISFFSGGVLYFIMQATEGYAKRSKVIAAMILIALGMLHVLGVPTGEHTIVFGMVIFPCILLLCLRSSVLNRIVSIAPLAYLGKISFSIYLCNSPFEILTDIINQDFDIGINFSSGLFFFANAILQIAVATLYWKVFEDIVPQKLKEIIL